MRIDQDIDELVRKCLRQDQAAWSQLVQRFQNLVYSIPRRYGLDSDDASDVFQTTFQALFRNLDRIDDSRTLPKWLSVTASRESLRMLRNRSRSVGAEDIGLDLDTIVDEVERRSEDNAVQALESEQVRRSTNRLNSRCRDLLSKLYLESSPSYQEIAEQLGMAVGAIGPTRARCLEKLRANLDREGFFD